jgi:hypothetical protein
MRDIMINYTFLDNCRLAIRKVVEGQATSDGWVSVDVGRNVSFSQTITDKTTAQKTIQEPHKLHDKSSITKLNPLNAEFTVNIIEEDDYDLIYELLLDTDENGNLLPFEVLLAHESRGVENSDGTVTLWATNCYFTSGSFIIERSKNLALKLRAEGGYLRTFAANHQVYSNLLDSLDAARSATTTYEFPKYIECALDNRDITLALVSMNVELQNKIRWTPYEVLETSLGVDDTSAVPALTLNVPSKCTLQKRILAGSITRYSGFDNPVTDGTNQVNTFGLNSSIDIKAGNSATSGFHFDLENCSYTVRNNVADIFTATYDWKMNDNPTDLSTKILINPS